jgi:hypothetical protein
MQDNKFINWLIQRGITPSVIEQFRLEVHEHFFIGSCIKIPIQGTDFNKYRRDPEQDIKPKYISDKGLKAFLYGSIYITEASSVLITEGELDTLVAWSNNIPAVSSTGGANTFLAEWVELLKGKEVTICFDNDDAGAEGMVKVLALLPEAKVLLIPERPNIKDLTDYIKYGGDIHELLLTAKKYTDIEQVKDERALRISLFESVRFHDAYIEYHTPKVIPNSRYVARDNTKVERAKTYPIGNLIEFRQKKACCIWHNEKTPSLTYYPKTNTVYCFGCGKHGDAIDVYKQIHQCGFKEAVTDLNKLV